jgi:UDP-N-acetylglucosamine/UDP-N-acetylgalactosamine diphosphorylase
MFPIGPVSNASLFQIHFEKVLATSERYGAAVPIYVMTSPATHDETVAFLDDHHYFGLPQRDVTVFCQGTMPAVDAATGRLLLASRDRLFSSPDGHGGVVAALRDSGAAEQIRRRGLTELFYFQVDNPLVPVCDPRLIGYHRLAASELTTVVVEKASPWDRVGNAVSVDGRLRIIEYIDLPDDAATRQSEDGSLEIWAGSVAIHVFDTTFLDRVLESSDALPLHVSRKKVPHIDAAGAEVDPAEPNALKFERFVFDLVPVATNAIVVECARDDVFGPLKNAPGAASETAEWVRFRLLALHRRWLEQAGAIVAEGVPVEICPLMALDGEQLAARIERGSLFSEPTYLVPS